MSSALAITVFVVGVVVAIMIHEWGHFWTARMFGMRADRFFLGFGPTLWATRRGETEYGVKALPLGGFVRIKGMSPTDERLRPVPDVVLDQEAVAADRRAAASGRQTDLTEQATFSEATWQRLGDVLEQRGTPRELGDRIVHRARLNVPEDATLPEARRTLVEILTSEVSDTGRVGDLHHRLLKGDEGRFFADRPAWQRAIVLVSGSVMHFVQAIVLLFLGFLLFGQTVVLPVIDSVQPGTPAAAVGLEPGDELVAVAGEPVDGFEQVRERIRASAEQPLELTVARGDDRFDVTATPTVQEDPETGETFGVLGFVPSIDHRPQPASQALAETFLGDGSFPALSLRTFEALGTVFGPEGIGAIFDQVAGESDRDETGAISMVGAARAAGSGTSAFGPLFLFVLLASINVFVGIFNLLPLPPLDGGHLAVLGVERSVNGVRGLLGRAQDFSIDPRAVAAVAIPVIVLIGTLSLALVWLDVVNPVRIGP